MIMKARIAAFVFGFLGFGAGSFWLLFVYAHTSMNITGEASLQAMFTKPQYLPGALVGCTIVTFAIIIICISIVAAPQSHASSDDKQTQGRRNH